MQLKTAARRHYEAVISVGDRFFTQHASELAGACWGMARRFHVGGKLVIWAPAGAGFSDAQHNAVEFIHPVIVGKRALPAMAVRERRQASLMLGPRDILMELEGARLRVMDQELCVDTDDLFVSQEILETAYHELWELVHVFFEHEGLLQEACTDEVCLTCGDVALPAAIVHVEGSRALVRTVQGEEAAEISLVEPVRPGDLVLVHGGVALERLKPIDEFSQEFYPFLSNQAVDVPSVLADVARSVCMKWDEVKNLRLVMDFGALDAALEAVTARVRQGGKVLAFGNGGSSTDAADLAADLLDRDVPAVDLSGEPSVITAVGNDIGFEEVFARQVIALGAPGDVALGITTSGCSGNVTRALQQAKRQGLLTVALAGYGGGALKQEPAVDHLLVTDSTYIPRIQEAQATIYHALVRGLEESR